jgi:hypothetical protein
MFPEITEVALIAVSASFMNEESSIFQLHNGDFNAESIVLHNFDLWGMWFFFSLWHFKPQT